MPIDFDYEGEPFPARDADGKTYLLTPLYRCRVTAAGERLETRSATDCVGFRSDAGHLVGRDGEERGRYLILDTDPATILESEDPKAV